MHAYAAAGVQQREAARDRLSLPNRKQSANALFCYHWGLRPRRTLYSADPGSLRLRAPIPAPNAMPQSGTVRAWHYGSTSTPIHPPSA
jgi:hypothetical protein